MFTTTTSTETGNTIVTLTGTLSNFVNKDGVIELVSVYEVTFAAGTNTVAATVKTSRNDVPGSDLTVTGTAEQKFLVADGTSLTVTGPASSNGKYLAVTKGTGDTATTTYLAIPEYGTPEVSTPIVVDDAVSVALVENVDAIAVDVTGALGTATLNAVTFADANSQVDFANATWYTKSDGNWTEVADPSSTNYTATTAYKVEVTITAKAGYAFITAPNGTAITMGNGMGTGGAQSQASEVAPASDGTGYVVTLYFTTGTT